MVLVAAMAWGVYGYLYKKHRNISEEKASFETTSVGLFEEFSKDEVAANNKYLDKTILVTGKISNVDSKGKMVSLDSKVVALFLNELPQELKESQVVKIKGRFLGYDDLLEEVKMDQCDLVDDK